MDIIEFLKKWGPKWGIKSKTPPSANFPIGSYRLDMQIVGLSGLLSLRKSNVGVLHVNLRVRESTMHQMLSI